MSTQQKFTEIEKNFNDLKKEIQDHTQIEVKQEDVREYFNSLSNIEKQSILNLSDLDIFDPIYDILKNHTHFYDSFDDPNIRTIVYYQQNQIAIPLLEIIDGDYIKKIFDQHNYSQSINIDMVSSFNYMTNIVCNQVSEKFITNQNHEEFCHPGTMKGQRKIIKPKLNHLPDFFQFLNQYLNTLCKGQKIMVDAQHYNYISTQTFYNSANQMNFKADKQYSFKLASQVHYTILISLLLFENNLLLQFAEQHPQKLIYQFKQIQTPISVKKQSFDEDSRIKIQIPNIDEFIIKPNKSVQLTQPSPEGNIIKQLQNPQERDQIDTEPKLELEKNQQQMENDELFLILNQLENSSHKNSQNQLKQKARNVLKSLSGANNDSDNTFDFSTDSSMISQNSFEYTEIECEDYMLMYALDKLPQEKKQYQYNSIHEVGMNQSYDNYLQFQGQSMVISPNYFYPPYFSFPPIPPIFNGMSHFYNMPIGIPPHNQMNPPQNLNHSSMSYINSNFHTSIGVGVGTDDFIYNNNNNINQNLSNISNGLDNSINFKSSASTQTLENYQQQQPPFYPINASMNNINGTTFGFHHQQQPPMYNNSQQGMFGSQNQVTGTQYSYNNNNNNNNNNQQQNLGKNFHSSYSPLCNNQQIGTNSNLRNRGGQSSQKDSRQRDDKNTQFQEDQTSGQYNNSTYSLKKDKKRSSEQKYSNKSNNSYNSNNNNTSNSMNSNSSHNNNLYGLGNNNSGNNNGSNYRQGK